MIKRIPLPITGVMLGMAALGNLLQSYSEGVRLVCGIISAIIGILFILKVIMYPKLFVEDMKNPIMASVSGTFSMAIMLLAAYAKPYIGQAAIYIWYLGIALHLALIIYFTVKFLLHLNMPKVFASYYIVYVGIVVVSISAPAFEKTGLGTAAFWFGFVSVLVLLVLVTYRYLKFKEVPEPAQPLFCIYTAPVSLCLAGYIQSVTPKSVYLIGFMAILATVLYIAVLIQLPKYLTMKFYPSYAAFTFPFVITAIGLKMTMACLANLGTPIPALTYIVLAETIIAAILTVYTLIRFCLTIAAAPATQNKTSPSTN